MQCRHTCGADRDSALAKRIVTNGQRSRREAQPYQWQGELQGLNRTAPSIYAPAPTGPHRASAPLA